MKRSTAVVPHLIATIGLVMSLVAGSASPSTEDEGVARFEWGQMVVSGVEGSRVRVEVVRLGAAHSATSVRVTTADASASSLSDYRLLGEWIDWRAGESGAKSLWIDLVDDGDREGIETFQVGLASMDGSSTPASRTIAVRESVTQSGTEFGLLGDPRIDQVGVNTAAPFFSDYSLGGQSDGNRVITAEIACPNGQTLCEGGGLFARRFSPENAPLGPSFAVNPNREGAESEGSVAYGPAGVFAIVWRQTEENGRRSILGRVFDASGDPATGIVVIDESPSAQLHSPIIAGDLTGGYNVTWHRNDEILVERFGRGPSVRRRVAGGGVMTGAKVRSTALGETIVVWHEAGAAQAARSAASQTRGAFDGSPPSGASSILGRRFSPSGEPRGEPFVIATTDETDFDASIEESGDVNVVFKEPTGDRIIGAKVSSDDETREQFEVTESAGVRSSPRISTNGSGDSVVSWDEEIASDGEVKGRMIDRRGQALTGIATVAAHDDLLFDANDSSLSLTDSRDVHFVYRRGPALRGSTITVSPSRGDCQPTASNLCLASARFDVRATWATPAGASSAASATPLSDDTGTLWFFEPGNVEALVKILDGCAVNGHYWLFAGGLTDLQVQLLVTDTRASVTRRYVKTDFDRFAPIRDLEAFTCDPAAASSPTTSLSHANSWPTTNELRWLEESRQLAQLRHDTSPSNGDRNAVSSTHERQSVDSEGQFSCQTRADVLCLADRFKVRLDWETTASSGEGRTRAFSRDSGMFWIFDPANIEVFVKILDGCAINGHYWVFAAGLTDIEIRLRITDADNGDTQFYRSPAGTLFETVVDLTRFGCG